MKLSKYLSEKRVGVFDASDKQVALSCLLDLLKGSSRISDHDKFCQNIWQREKTLPTGIGLGIGVPHVRCKSVRDSVAAMGIFRNEIDYGSMDGKPVRIILLIGMPQGTHTDYLQYLAKASNLLQKDSFRNSLLNCKNAVEVWQCIKDV